MFFRFPRMGFAPWLRLACLDQIKDYFWLFGLHLMHLLMEFGLKENSTPKLSVLGFPGKSGNMFFKNIVFCNNFLSSAQVCVKERKQLLRGWTMEPFPYISPVWSLDPQSHTTKVRSVSVAWYLHHGAPGACTMAHHGAVYGAPWCRWTGVGGRSMWRRRSKTTHHLSTPGRTLRA